MAVYIVSCLFLWVMYVGDFLVADILDYNLCELLGYICKHL